MTRSPRLPSRTARARSAAHVLAAGCLLVGLSASAQDNPLDRTVGGDATAEATAAAMQTPEWVQPGARIVYSGGSLSRWAGSGEDNPGGSSAGQGMIVYDVLAVAPRGVLVRESALFKTDPSSPAQGPAGSSTRWVTPMLANAGQAFFMPTQTLAGMQTGDGVQVTRGPMPMHGQTYDSVLIQLSQGVGADGRVSQNANSFEVTYEANTGLKLMEMSAQRGGQGSRESVSQSAMRFESFRQREGAWIGQTWPQWTQQVTEVVYAGEQVYQSPGVPALSMPTQMVFSITERGDGWVTGTMQTQTTNPLTGQAEAGAGEGQPFAMTVHELGSLWMSPQALAALPEGAIDNDPTTGAVTRFARANQAGLQTGTVTTTYSDGSSSAATYDMVSGLCTGIQIRLNAFSQTMRLELQSYR